VGTHVRINLIEWLARVIDASRPGQVEGDATLLQVNGSGYCMFVPQA
jgi:transcription factor E2F3